jgi:hypothetical protein
MSVKTKHAEVKASSPIRTSLYEREGSMWGRLKRPSPRHTTIEESVANSAAIQSEKCHYSRQIVPLFESNYGSIHYP